jgi:hypothetical protein
MAQQSRSSEKSIEDRIRKYLLTQMDCGGTKTVSLEAAGLAMLGIAMMRIADAIERAEARDGIHGD